MAKFRMFFKTTCVRRSHCFSNAALVWKAATLGAITTCLSLVIGYNKDDYYSKMMARNSLMDVLVLMISAKADVCAINFHGESVSDIAFASEHGEVWTEALKYCGIDIKDVLSRRNANSAYSSALNPQYHQDPTRAVTSKLSLAEYLERRNVVEEEVACADVNSESDDTQKTRN